ncbi:MAG: hypothetical protein HYV99_09450, partial [Betaproteobacteria bacterium]|nr:hypothetical protein [Betaproteobacteria bacterium]
MRYDTDQPIPPSRIGFCAPVLGGGILVALVVFLIYWPARENGFVFDDWVVLDVDNVTGIRDPALWRETLFRSPADFSTLFRPLTMLTFLLQLWTDPLEPRPFHIVNLAVHSINVFLLVLVASRLPGGDVRANTRPLLAVLCGLVYGIHPALTEPVVWISARADLLMTLFLMLALLLDLMLLETGWRRAAAVGSLFLAAMLCKESAVAFLLVLPMVHLAAHWLEPRAIGRGVLANVWGQHCQVYIALLVALVVYLAARFAIFGPTFGVHTARHISPVSQHI